MAQLSFAVLVSVGTVVVDCVVFSKGAALETIVNNESEQAMDASFRECMIQSLPIQTSTPGFRGTQGSFERVQRHFNLATASSSPIWEIASLWTLRHGLLVWKYKQRIQGHF